mmetsp:Transcript_24687/g.32218  ORF Transcript_24687/g.32218 Transcript_24687/m.32218 type:complete len:199 (-) Transcript_24687:381-977(-)
MMLFSMPCWLIAWMLAGTILQGFFVILSSGQCNVTKYETEWLNQYGDELELATMMCKEALMFLKYDLAGRHGPVDDIYLYDVMCNVDCVSADSLHNAAIRYSGDCTCLDLSTPEGDLYYSEDRHGDFCLENTGRMLCEVLEVCENWECDLDDFMCPRFNFNKKFITHRGYGDCSMAAKMLTFGLLAMMLWVLTTISNI